MKLIMGLIASILLTGPVYAGAWGAGSFENDDALDWVDECVKATSPVPVSTALKTAILSNYLEVPEGSRAVAAAEVVATALGKPNPKLPPQLRAWVQRQSSKSLVQLAPAARKALARVLDPKASELRQLWSEGTPNNWPEVIAELQSRLGR